MDVAFVGLGKLGLPVAVATSLSKEFRVKGYDVNPKIVKKWIYPHREEGRHSDETFQDCLERSPLEVVKTLEEVVNGAELIFVAVQTPHEEKFSGSTRLTTYDRKDFNYSYLVKSCKELSSVVKKDQTVSIISTVLPGTIRREVVPVLGKVCNLVYNPFFIAMGTVVKDFLNPEFVLVGSESEDSVEPIRQFYFKLLGTDPKFQGVKFPMSYESAELTKVSYNLFISQKIVFANALMEISHKTPGCNVDDVTTVLGKATDRLISPKYMSGGVGDGGGCHPRDAIAMSYLARKLGLSFNPFEVVSEAREKQAEWLCDVFVDEAGDLPKVILGRSFKPQTRISDGSCALLIADTLRGYGHSFCQYDPYIDFMTEEEMWSSDVLRGDKPVAVLIATKHECFTRWSFPWGSIVVDPFRYIPDQEGVRVIRVGIGKTNMGWIDDLWGG